MRILACAVLLTACSPAAVTAVCGQDLLTCSGVCTATSSDAHNCGACGHACAATEICTGGHCELPACQADLVRCSGVCVDVGTDEANCGGCGHGCAGAESCIAGKCVAPCAAGATECSGACVVLGSDRANCGACGHACAVHEVCSAGACALTCQSPLANCNGACVDLADDSSNCGSCSHSCGGNVCSGGQCGAASGCGVGLAPCGGVCVDVQTSNANCGACGHACGSAQSCSSGTCTCPSGGTACGTACVDLDTSGANCGACGHACGSDQVCSTGSCACAVSGQSLCGSHCADLTSDAANCGACGHACAVGEACSSSVCACATGTQVCTGSTACIDTATDADNCGTCGHACGSGETCNGGSCAAETSAFVQLGGDARHSGFNGGEAGTPPVTAAWVAKLGSGATTPAVIEGGRAFANSGSFLHAVELANGAEIWSYNFGSAFGVGWPSAGDRALYVATSNNAGDTWFRQIDRGTGAATFKLPFSSQWEHYWSPLIVGSKAYIDGGYGSGLYGFDLTNGGSQIFFDNYPREYVIGITGTKGKSTTASLIHHILKHAGKPAELVGNIGRLEATRGYLDAGARAFQRSLALAEAESDGEHAAGACKGLGDVLFAQSQWSGAEAWFARGLQYAESNRALAGPLSLALGQTAHRRGEYSAAAARLQRAQHLPDGWPVPTRSRHHGACAQ